MNAPARIAEQTDWFAAWQRECRRVDEIQATLDRALVLLKMETKRRRLKGEDVEHIEAFIREASA